MIKAIKNRVILRYAPLPNTTESGIYLGEYEMPNSIVTALVISVGDKVRDIKEGDNVLVLNTVGEEIFYENTRYVAVLEGDVMAKI